MLFDPDLRPKLRPVEALPAPEAGSDMIALRDPSGLSPVMLTVTPPVLFILAHFDGGHTLRQVAAAFARQFRQALPFDKLEALVTHLRQGYFLDDESFEDYYQGLVEAYRSAPARIMRSAQELGIGPDIGGQFDAWTAEVPAVDGDAHLVGLIAPHLDYPRGALCYAAAYAQLRHGTVPERVVVLGTNHFGRSATAVVTGKDFATPLGTTRTDVELLERLEDRCGNLHRYEFDHQREHSVELQVLWCQHLFGPERFTLVPVLCPDPCGPTGTQPYTGEGVDLGDFARVLAECIREDGKDTLFIAGADLSHVGAHFGDDRLLDDTFLPEVRDRDQRVLQALVTGGPDAFVACVAEEGNPTRICSAGCVFTLMTALPGAQARLLQYHQAVHEPTQTGVTCAAVLLTR